MELQLGESFSCGFSPNVVVTAALWPCEAEHLA